jgi:hypothetical protein
MLKRFDLVCEIPNRIRPLTLNIIRRTHHTPEVSR